ncbi:MAG: hypothetical protein ACRYF9_11595 [Janthinobacterium lividum]|jgi:hypothetical protein|uniref:hypothetical protein n=1 Tax=Pseudomonas sp. MWU16-30317 TaxID=2878095 RepID=UPI001CFA8D0F|nr:hypothetical protein [Pseudomonas sp. MWU16-30317]
MIRTSFTALTFALVMAGCSIGAQADDSTGPTNPAPKGTNPSTVGVPAGTSQGMPNGNTDGSATTGSAGSSGANITPQKSGNPEGSSMGGQTNKANSAGDDDDDDDDAK